MLSLDLFNGKTTVVALHRVLSEQQLTAGLIDTQNMVLSCEKLEYFVNCFLNRGGQFVSIDDALIGASESRSRIAITVDDGYIDFYEQLYPILCRYNIPACVYVVSGFPDDQCFDSYGTLAHFVEQNRSHQFDLEGKFYNLSFDTFDEKKTALLYLDEVVEKLITNTDMMSAFSLIKIPLNGGDRKRLTLSWQLLKELSISPLITIGSHSVTHPRLTKVSPARALSELLGSKVRLEQQIGCRIDHFAFPYGDYNSAIANLAKQVNYKSAATVEPGHIDATSTDIYSLPRIWMDCNLNKVIR